MPIRHYQLFKFSLASEAVLPDNSYDYNIVTNSLPFVLPLSFLPMYWNGFWEQYLPSSVDRALWTIVMYYNLVFQSMAMVKGVERKLEGSQVQLASGVSDLKQQLEKVSIR